MVTVDSGGTNPEHATGTGGGDTLGAEIVPWREELQPKGKILARTAGGINAIGVGAGTISGHLQIGMEGRLNGFDPRKVVVREFTGRHLAALQLLTPLGDRHRKGLLHSSDAISRRRH